MPDSAPLQNETPSAAANHEPSAAANPKPPVATTAGPHGRFDLPILVAGALVATAFALPFWSHTVDDAFISFRYARNLVEGHGLVFNPGERVEGYTNFLWVVLLAGALAVDQDPETAGRVLGLAFHLATLAAIVWFCGRRACGRPALLFGALLFALSPAGAVWATGGLEAPLFACLATWGICLTADGTLHGRLPLWSAVLLGLSVLARPDGVLLAGAACLPAAVAIERRERGRSVLVWLAVFLAIVGPWFLWRWHYYGWLLPNTFYAKVDVGGRAWQRGLGYTHTYLSGLGYWLLLLLGGWWFRNDRRGGAAIAGAALLYIIYVIYVGGDGLPMSRFFAPIVPLLAILLALGGDALMARARRPRLRWIFVALMLGGVAWSARPAFRGLGYAYVLQDMREVETWKQIGTWFREHARPGDTLAVIPAGAMPYFSRLPTLDMLGLNDAVIAHTPIVNMGTGIAGHEKHNVKHVLDKAPTYIVIGVYRLTPEPAGPSRQMQPFYPPELGLLRRPEFHQRYRFEQARARDGYFGYFERIAP